MFAAALFRVGGRQVAFLETTPSRRIASSKFPRIRFRSQMPEGYFGFEGSRFRLSIALSRAAIICR